MTTATATEASEWRIALDGIDLPVPPDWAPAFRDDAGWRVLLDEEFFEWLTDDATDPALRKRAYFCLRELLVNGRCARVKPVQGAARGWLRTPLGGSGGSHFYLWWAPYGTPAVADAGLRERQVLVRTVRHHDETGKALDVGRSDRHALALEEVVHPSGETPFTDEQLTIATSAEAPVQLVRGAPGSGKTTALWLAGSFATGTKAIYLTYSRGLARTAEDYFRAFGPEGTAVDVLTFEDLLVELADAHPGAIDFMAPARGAERLREALADFRQPLGPWKDHIDELYAELHAHAVGRGLPIEFRGVLASDGPLLTEGAYVRLRGDEIGPAAARTAHAVARHLVDEGLLEDLFPGPVHARALVLGPEAPPPPRFEGVTSFIVDEVQDLTMAEAMLVLSLAVRIGVDLGAMPNLLIGGDEAQTVRPTDFRWAWFADLIGEVLGPRLGRRVEHNLSTNLRSPRLIASIIENSRQHYQRFDKGMRPAGLSYVEADDTAVSRVVYCRAVSDGDWARVREFFATTPSGQLVYPGYRVPADLATRDDPAAEEADADIATSEQVKGLDYQLVGVIDAGRIDHELGALAERADVAPLVALWGRTLADQFRVAVSRATETLVLLDRGEEDFTAAIQALCGGDAAEVLEEIDADGLFELLDEDVDPAELLAAQLDEVRRILDDDPLRALRRVRTAHRILERSRIADDAIELLAGDTLRLHGVAAAVAVRRLAKQLDAASLRSYEAEAAKWLSESGHAALYEIVKRIDPSILERPTATGTLELLADVDAWFVEVEKDLPELEEPVRTTLTRWVRVLPEADLSMSDQAVDRVLGALDGVVSTFEARHPELLAEREHCYQMQADRAAEAGRFDRALRLHRAVPHEDPMFEARCLEGLGRWDEAAAAHEVAGRFEDALRCAREIPDFVLATRFADRVDLGVAARMRWATQLMTSLDPERLGVGEPITEAEETALLDHVAEALASARSSVPAPRHTADAVAATFVEVAGEDAKTGQGGTEGDEPASAELPEPTSEPGDAVERQAESAATAPAAGSAAPARQPLRTVVALAEELQIDVADCLALCSKLGIRAGSGEATIPEFMAERVRRRAVREGMMGSASTTDRNDEIMDAGLLERLLDVVQPGDEVLTVANGKPNVVIALDASGAMIETKRSSEKGGAKHVPAWMFNEAWRMLQHDGTIANADLIEKVKRSSAVLALLAQLAEVEVESSKPTVLRLRDQ